MPPMTGFFLLGRGHFSHMHNTVVSNAFKNRSRSRGALFAVKQTFFTKKRRRDRTRRRKVSDGWKGTQHGSGERSTNRISVGFDRDDGGRDCGEDGV